MTRKLFTAILIMFFSLSIASCSLFQSDEDKVGVDEVDGQSLSVEDGEQEEDFGDEEVGDELDDLSEGDDEDDGGEGDDEEDDTEDVAEEELGDEDEDEFDEGDDDEFAEDDDDEEVDEEDEFESASLGDDELDEELAEEELEDDLEEQGEASDEFVMEAEPIDEEEAIEEELGTAEVGEEGSEEAFEDPLEGAGPGEMTAAAAGPLNNKVTNLQYKSFANGGTVVIETSAPAEYQIREEPDLNQFVVEVDGVNLPEQFKRPYITKDFQQDVATINAYQSDGGSTARFVIQLKRPVKPVVQQEGNSILVMTSGPQVEDAMEMAVRDQIGEPEDPIDEPVGGAEFTAKAADGLPKNSNTLGDLNFRGEPINLEVTGIDVRDVIQTIAEQSGINLIIDSDVKGPVNIRLRQVPWDQALLVVLRSQQLGYVRQGNVLRIAKQATLSTEAEAIQKQIENEKRAQLLSAGIKVKYIPISYADVNNLQDRLKPFLSQRGQIIHDERTSSLVITDYEEFIERVTKLVKALDTAPKQVEIEAKLVEAREDFLRETGINWNLSGEAFSIGGDRSGTITTRSGPLRAGSTNRGMTLDLNFGTFDVIGNLAATLGLFEEQDKVKVLSSPRIVTVNNQKASISQVTQIPISQITNNQGTTTETVFYRDLILSLDVTPQITFKGDVILKVKVIREFAGSADSTGERELNRRQAETTVMVKSGQTAVIGGIYQNDFNEGETGIPLLKDLPIIGYLFRSNTKERRKNELLLFLKPKIINPVTGALARADTSGMDIDELSVDEGSDDEAQGDEGFDDEDDDSDFDDEADSLEEELEEEGGDDFADEEEDF